MADDVKIRITAEDKTDQGVKGAKSNFEGFKGTLNDVAKELTGFSLTSIGVAGAVGMVAGEIRKTISEYSAYVESVDKVSMATGMQAEEASRLIQLADDFRVSQGSLETAMKMALQNGFVPTVENLAKLSDRYREIKDPAERAAEMQKIFGRSWQEMVPMLERGGDAIRDAAAGIDDGLVVTQDAIDANREYQKSVDDLSDSWTAFKFTLAREVVPALADFLKTWNESMSAQKEGYGKIEGLGGAYASIAIQQKRAADAAKGWASGQRGAMVAAKATGEAVQQAIDPIKAQASAYDAMGSRYQTAIDNSHQHQAAILAEKEAQDQLTEATKAWTDAQQDFNESFGDKVVSRLEQAGVKGGKYEDALAAMDKTLGTTYQAQNRANKELDEAIRKYAQTGNIDDFTSALGENKDQWAALDKNLQAAKTDFEKAQGAFNNMMRDIATAAGKTWTVKVDFSGSGGNGGGNDQGRCFVYDTPVDTPTGPRPIGEIRAGDSVLLKTDGGRIVTVPVQRTITGERSDLVRLTTSDGQEIHCSPNHPFKVGTAPLYRFVLAAELEPGMRLVSAHRRRVTVIGIQPHPGTHTVYNLHVDHPEHTYLAGGLVVHNAKPSAASGLDMIVPAGYNNDTFTIRASTNEHVKITSGERESAAAGSIVIQSMTIIANNPAQLATALGQKAAQARKAGAGYAGRA